MSFSITPMTDEHLASIRPGVFCLRSLEGLGKSSLVEAVAEFRARGPFWAGLSDGEVVGGAGLIPYVLGGKRIGQALAFVDHERLQRATLGACKAIRRVLGSLIEEYKLDECEAYVAKGFDQGFRFAALFGFLPESGEHQYPQGVFVRCVRRCHG